MDDMILASSGGSEERIIDYPYDIEVGGDNTFELEVPIYDWIGDMTLGKRLYIPGTEYGGVIKAIESDTSKKAIFVRGHTWRGYLYKRFIKGAVSGDINTVIGSMLGAYAGVFAAADPIGLSVSWTFSDYTTVADAIDTLISPYGYKLRIRYVQTDKSGYAELCAVPAAVYGDEVSQDNLINFSVKDDHMNVNHLIVSDGTYEADVYADTYGNISTTQTQIGIDEISDILIANVGENLVEEGEKALADMIVKKTMTATFDNSNDIDLDIGDLAVGRDYVTGIVITKPITSKIITYRDNELSIEYEIEEGEA